MRRFKFLNKITDKDEGITDDQENFTGIANFLITSLNQKLTSINFFSQLPENFRDQYKIVAKIDASASIVNFGATFELSEEMNNSSNIEDVDTKFRLKRLEKRLDKLVNRFSSCLEILNSTRISEVSLGISSGNIPLIGDLAAISVSLATSLK